MQVTKLCTGWELTPYKAKIHAQHKWSTFDKSARHQAQLDKEEVGHAAAMHNQKKQLDEIVRQEKEKLERTVDSLRTKLRRESRTV